MKPWLFVGVVFYKISIGFIGLFQTELVSDSAWRILEEVPTLTIFLGALYYLLKWMERMLELQKQGMKEIYDGQQVFLNTLLSQIETKQNKMADRIELLTQQVAMFRETLSEAVNVKDVVDQLMEKIKK